jgi:D-arabinose 1-dehydrogenase-like Zn-dependent alcohol dehydrogenase
MTSTTYRAVQVTAPGRLELVERELIAPPPGKVRIRIEASGICHTDAVTVDGLVPGIAYPRVPGHEVVGRIDALGDGVSNWKLGQQVGVGSLGGHCGRCTPCRRGDFVNCQNQSISGVSYDGGAANRSVTVNRVRRHPRPIPGEEEMNEDFKTAVNQDALLETFAAELALAAYRVALRTRTQGTWLDLELDLWRAQAATAKTCGSDSDAPLYSVKPLGSDS